MFIVILNSAVFSSIPDAVLARAIEVLGESGAVAIGVDLYRPTPANDTAEALEGWRDLGRVVAHDRRIVMSDLLPSRDEPGTPAPRFADPGTQVGFNDLLQVLSLWGPCFVTCCPADVDGDDVVGFADLLEVLSFWGPCP